MLNFRKIITYSPFFSLLILFLLLGFASLYLFGKIDTFLFLNGLRVTWLNYFFILCTFLGDGIFVVLLGLFIIFYFKKKQLGIQVIVSYAVSGIIAQLIKDKINAPRPASVFNNGEIYYFVEGLELAKQYGFPSGHTTSAFALATTIILVTRTKKYQVPLFFFACIIGFSRIYLAQHFLIDVLCGAMLGTICSILIYWLLLGNKGRKDIWASIKGQSEIQSGL